MPKEPEFVRCSLSIFRLATIEAFPHDKTSESTTVRIIVDLVEGLDAWKADAAIGQVKHPEGVTLKTIIRFTPRLVLEAVLPSGLATTGEALRLLGRIVDSLMSLE